MKTFYTLLLLCAIGSLLHAQSIQYRNTIQQGELIATPANATIDPPKISGPEVVTLTYFDPNLQRLQWQIPRNYNSFINLYLMQRFTLPNSRAYLDSVTIWIEDINQGAVRIRVIPDTIIDFGNATFRLPNFGILYDIQVINKAALKMRAWNTIKMSGATVPKDFFVTVEFTVDGTTNNIITLHSDSRTASHRSEQDSRTVMINQVGSDVQAAIMDSLFTISGGIFVYPYLLMQAHVDTSTFSDTPVITTTPVVTAYTNLPYKYTVHASGVPRPQYSLLLAPPSMTINLFSGEINWTPGVSDIGDRTISLRAQNSNGSQDQTYTLRVIQSTAPKITSTPKKLGIVNELYSYQLAGIGNPAPTFALAAAPQGMTINTSGLISWVPGPTQAGNYNIAVYAKNGVANDTQRYVLRIETSPSAPNFTSVPKTTVTVGQLYSYQVTVSGNPQPIFSLTKSPAGMLIDQVTGLISWQTNAGQEGTYEVSVHAENRVGSKDQNYNLVVSPPTASPQITSTPITSAIAEQPYTYNVTATGTPPPTFALTTSPSGMQINANTGAITWTPTRAQKGNNNVLVRATNSAGTNDQPFTINVRTIPRITSTAILAAEVGKQYQYQVVADADPAAKFSLLQAPQGMKIDSTTGLIIWTPVQAQVGTQQVTVRASNSASNADQQFTITVTSTVSVEKENNAENFRLIGVYPNPLLPHESVTIDYALQKTSFVTIELRNILGQKLATLFDDRQDAGAHRIAFQPSTVLGDANGIYLLVMRSGSVVQSRVMVVVR